MRSPVIFRATQELIELNEHTQPGGLDLPGVHPTSRTPNLAHTCGNTLDIIDCTVIPGARTFALEQVHNNLSAFLPQTRSAALYIDKS